MSHIVEFTSAARQDVTEIFDWYEKQRPGLGQTFRVEIRRLGDRIAENPDQFPRSFANTRRARLRRFPYGLFFKIDGNQAFIIACFHSSRDPRLLKTRR